MIRCILLLLAVWLALPGYAGTQVYGNFSTPDSLFESRGEVYFRFSMKKREDIRKLTRIISIDNVKGLEVLAYANKKEFTEFLKYGAGYEILTPPGLAVPEKELIPPDVPGKRGVRTLWNFYPSYQQYLDFMSGFASSYPAICRLDTIGESIQGRLILAVRISDNIQTEEAEPQFFYTSSIHGDETAGYVLMLHLIDHLLSGYGTEPEITELVNSTEIVINPLANPDGTYKGGNNSVYGAVRYNSAGFDLNRNYPDPKWGSNPYGDPWQKETVAFMDYASENYFTMSANFHGGAEVFNYPWDCWSRLAADDDWWQFVGREWADTVHVYGPPGYFDDEVNGITNGYAWYEVHGGRQDYMNYWHGCREVTLEISNIKLLPVSQLLPFWDYNHRSFLNYIRQAGYGVSGIVTDTVTDLPVEAKLSIHGHDLDNSEVYSRPSNGFYSRHLADGSYNLTFSAPGYFPKTISGVTVQNRTLTSLDVQLRPLTFDAQDKSEKKAIVFPNPNNGIFQLTILSGETKNICSFQVLNALGSVVHAQDAEFSSGRSSVQIDLSHLPPGMYFLRFNSGYRIFVDKLVIRR